MSSYSRPRKVPDNYYHIVSGFAKQMNIPTTKAFIVREKLLRLDFTCRVRKRSGSGKTVFELDFGDLKL